MMDKLCWLVFLSGSYPVWKAWQANRRTALYHTMNWAGGAWAMWAGALGMAGRAPETTAPVRYLALCLTACGVVAVLGARRPGTVAWNFVVLGFLAVTLLPLAQAEFAGNRLHLEWYQAAVPGAVLVVGVLNYLPTRVAPAAVCLAGGCAVELLTLTGPDSAVGFMERLSPLTHWLLDLAPWMAYAGIRRRPQPASDFDHLWTDFRDRFGLVWSQRLREQFNRSAFHAGWPVHLYWQGLRVKEGLPRPEPGVQAEIVATLVALMKRFGSEKRGQDP
jgi:hypothetical protein